MIPFILPSIPKDDVADISIESISPKRDFPYPACIRAAPFIEADSPVMADRYSSGLEPGKSERFPKPAEICRGVEAPNPTPPPITRYTFPFIKYSTYRTTNEFSYGNHPR